MEGLLTRAAVGMAVINTGLLLWLYRQPMPPDHIPDTEAVQLPHEGVQDAPTIEDTTQEMALLDDILAARLTAEAAARGVEPALPEAALREAAAGAAPDSDAALLLLAAYERAFADLGLSLDGLGG